MGGSIAIEAATQLSGLRGLIVSEPTSAPMGDFLAARFVGSMKRLYYPCLCAHDEQL
jgi:hypothetical protein